MNRFILFQQEDGRWQCADTRHLIQCTFEEHKFNETQEFVINDSNIAKEVGASGVAKIVNEMGAWLRDNHYEIAMPADARLVIGQKIARLRKKRGLLQKELADKVGMQQQSIARLEAGKFGTRIDIIARIVEALDAHLEIVENSDK